MTKKQFRSKEGKSGETVRYPVNASGKEYRRGTPEDKVHVKGHGKFDKEGRLITPVKKKQVQTRGKGQAKTTGAPRERTGIRRFKGTEFELAKDGFKSKTEAQAAANSVRLATGNKVRVKNIYGSWGVWTETGQSDNPPKRSTRKEAGVKKMGWHKNKEGAELFTKNSEFKNYDTQVVYNSKKNIYEIFGKKKSKSGKGGHKGHKTKRGLAQDQRLKSKEPHEVAYRKSKKKMVGRKKDSGGIYKVKYDHVLDGKTSKTFDSPSGASEHKKEMKARFPYAKISVEEI